MLNYFTFLFILFYFFEKLGILKIYRGAKLNRVFIFILIIKKNKVYFVINAI
jgi:hypothetical protein